MPLSLPGSCQNETYLSLYCRQNAYQANVRNHFLYLIKAFLTGQGHDHGWVSQLVKDLQYKIRTKMQPESSGINSKLKKQKREVGNFQGIVMSVRKKKK